MQANRLLLQRNLERLRSLRFGMQPASPARTFSAAAAQDSKVLFDQHSACVTEWKLNSPKALNSVDTEMCNIMIDEMKRWNSTGSSPRVLMMSGMGGKAFCAGGDIVSLYKAHKTEGADKSILANFFAREFLLDFALSQMTATRQISLWNGICMGGGVGLTWHSPVKIATDNSMYAMPETAIGFFCDVGGSYFLSRVKNDISLGLYLGLTGQRVKSRDLVKWGLATHFVPADSIDELRSRLINGVNAQSSDAEIDAIVASLSDQSAAQEQIEDLDEIRAIF